MMQTYCEAYIYLGSIEDTRATMIIREFAQHCSRYSYLSKESQDYSQDIELPAFMLLFKDKEKKLTSIIAFAKQKQKIFSITNIVPKAQSYLSMSDYNYIVKQFVNDFRSYVKKVNISIRIAVTPELVGLEHIIRGKKSRKLFEQFLSAYPRSYHPSDIERIDDFIRWIASHNARIDLQDLNTYLQFDLKWNNKDANWCTDRIETGLDILKPGWRLAVN